MQDWIGILNSITGRLEPGGETGIKQPPSSTALDHLISCGQENETKCLIGKGIKHIKNGTYI